MNLAPVILAAGASRRLGEPKALADLGGRSVLERLSGALRGISAEQLVITGCHDPEIRDHALRLVPAVEVAFNSSWSQGRTSGVALAAARRPGADLLICPADVPLVGASVMEALAERWQALGCPGAGWLAPSIILPASGGRQYGHPIILGAKLAAQACGLGADAPLRLLRARATPTATVETTDPAILDDLDTPADLRRLRSRLRGH